MLQGGNRGCNRSRDSHVKTASDLASTTKTASSVSTSTTAVTPARRRSIASIHIGKRMAHGSVQEHHGRLFKYHQVAARAWRGVPLEQWNERIHRRVTRDLTTMPLRRDEPPARLHAREIGPLGGSHSNGGSRPSTARGGVSPRGLSPLEKGPSRRRNATSYAPV